MEAAWTVEALSRHRWLPSLRSIVDPQPAVRKLAGEEAAAALAEHLELSRQFDRLLEAQQARREAEKGKG